LISKKKKKKKNEEDLGRICFEEILLPEEEDDSWMYQYRSTLLEDDKLRLLVNETRDIIESASFLSMFSSAFKCATDLITGRLQSSDNLHQSTLAFPRLLPLLIKVSATLFDQEKGLVKSLAVLDELNNFVYKTFQDPIRESDTDISCVKNSLHVGDIVSGSIGMLHSLISGKMEDGITDMDGNSDMMFPSELFSGVMPREKNPLGTSFGK